MANHTPTPREPVPERFWICAPQMVPVWAPTFNGGGWIMVSADWLPEFRKSVPDWPEDCFGEVEKALAMSRES